MSMMTWQEAQELKRGSLFDNKVVLYVDRQPRIGTSLPATVTFVLQNGEVWQYMDPGWTTEPLLRIEKPL